MLGASAFIIIRYVALLLSLYAVIRLAVKHGIQDANKRKSIN